MWKSRIAFTLRWYPRWVIKLLKPCKVHSYKNNVLSLMSFSSPVIFLLFDTDLREELSVLTLIPLLQLPLTLWSTTLSFLSLIELWKCSYHLSLVYGLPPTPTKSNGDFLGPLYIYSYPIFSGKVSLTCFLVLPVFLPFVLPSLLTLFFRLLFFLLITSVLVSFTSRLISLIVLTCSFWVMLSPLVASIFPGGHGVRLNSRCMEPRFYTWSRN